MNSYSIGFIFIYMLFATRKHVTTNVAVTFDIPEQVWWMGTICSLTLIFVQTFDTQYYDLSKSSVECALERKDTVIGSSAHMTP